jgi:hypothetical protein
MDTRNLASSNVYPGPASVSVDLPWIGTPSTNWSVTASQVCSVRLNPQIDLSASPIQSASSESLKRRVRRRLMTDLTDEFATWNDELLRELAR